MGFNPEFKGKLIINCNIQKNEKIDKISYTVVIYLSI